MTRPLIIALDPATHCGVCVGRAGETPTLSTQCFRSGRSESAEDVYGAAVHFFADFLRTRAPDLIAIEAPITQTWGKTNADVTAMTRGLYAIFTGIAKCKGIRIEPVAVSTWRKFALGKGNLKTEEAKAASLNLCRMLKWPAPDHNAAEAAGLWLYGCSLVAPKLVQRTEPLFAASRL